MSPSASTGASAASKASLSAFSSAARSESTGCRLYGSADLRKSGRPCENQRRFGIFRWARLDIGMPHLVKSLVAEIAMQQFMVVAHHLDQSRAIGMAIDAEQRLALRFGAVEDLVKDCVVAGQDTPLKRTLLPRKIAHVESCPAGSTCSAISRVRLTSAKSSSSGGILSSRSIMVETRPNRFSAAT